MSDTAEVSRARAWLIAARPHTLPAAAAPVLVGTGLALHDGVFAPLPALAALLGAALIQVGTNFANDYYDAKSGADEGAEGFTRVTQSGLLPQERVRLAMVGTFAAAILLGTSLVYVGGVPILVVGLASVASGILYTGGPYPFGYYGLGDLFVFVFFGLVAVTGTYYVQAVTAMASIGPFPAWVPPGTVTDEAVVASLPMAGLITAILVVNNVRDLETDRAAGKYTLAVLVGYAWSRVEYVGLLVLAYVVPLWFVARPGFGVAVLLPLVTLPLGAVLARTVMENTSEEALNPALERTGQLVAAYAVLFAMGLAA
ncbi:MAG: 1,4-dihydroxy-2-naphthoate polyprenyltransferase [Halobacteriales archaeon]